MRRIPPHCLFTLVAILGLSGCATLPNVSRLMDQAPTEQSPRPIVSTKGALSSEKSKAIMKRLKGSVEPTDLVERYVAVVESVSESPLTNGNKVSLLADGMATYAAMFKAMQGARDHINLESYIFEDDEAGRKFAALLLQKQKEGVQVRVIYDSVGSFNTSATFFQNLRDAGVQVVGFNPMNPLHRDREWGLTHRDHRKILIADGSVAIIGGVNISKVYSSSPHRRKQAKPSAIHWRDTDLLIEGPAVAEIQKLFLDSWKEQKGPTAGERNYFPQLKEKGKALVRVVGSTPGESNRIPFIVYVSAISFAENSIHLTNSYFIPERQLVKALTDAARRGVDVKIVVPGVTDSKLAIYAQRAHYSELLKAGVKIYEHADSLLHAKTAVIDGVWSTVGSTNLDVLSMLKNDEVNAIVLNKEFAEEMEKMFAQDVAKSKAITWEQWRKSPLLPRFRNWMVDFFAPWL